MCITQKTSSTRRQILIPLLFYSETNPAPAKHLQLNSKDWSSWAVFLMSFLSTNFMCSNLDSFKTARHTPLKTNISPQKGWLEDYTFLLTCSLSGDILINLWGCIFPVSATPTGTMNRQLPLERFQFMPHPVLDYPRFRTDFL